MVEEDRTLQKHLLDEVQRLACKVARLEAAREVNDRFLERIVKLASLLVLTGDLAARIWKG